VNTNNYVFSNYPLSAEYQSQLEQKLSHGGPSTLTFLSMAELRQSSLSAMLRKLRSLDAESVIIPVEDKDSAPLLPVLELIASIPSASQRLMIMPDLSVRHFSRRNALLSGMRLAGASIAAANSVRATKGEVVRLKQQERIAVAPKPGSERVLYLNANLWFGVKAGGSVGHIAGVANALLALGHPLDFASAGGRQLVDEKAALLALEPPRSFGVPFESNYYRFGRAVAEKLSARMKHEYAFIYQRMSIANYSGVQLSRHFRVPLILEYNGSEAWISKHWGRALRNHDLACAVEEVNLKHAHMVVTISDVLRDELIERGVAPARIVSYPNCIEPEMFEPARYFTQAAEVRKKYGLTAGHKVIGFLGTFGQWHGVDVLAHAIHTLAERDAEWLRANKVHFLLVGNGMKMPMVREILEGGAAREFVTLTGLIPQKQAPEYLAAADVLLSPHVANADGTKFFGSPTKLFEYMAMGKAIVASDLNQIGEVLADSLRTKALPSQAPEGAESQVAVLCEPGDVDDLIAGIRFCVSCPDWAAVLGANARREALAKYTWRHHVGAILQRMSALNLFSGERA